MTGASCLGLTLFRTDGRGVLGDVMGTCHYCMNCGRCRGEKPHEFYVRKCPACGRMNDKGTKRCMTCEASLLLEPGTTNFVGVRTLKTSDEELA
ncbi:MAG: hypothetical protein RR547_13525 [Raoultibacter sp.]